MLDTRSRTLLEVLIFSPGVSNVDLQKKLNISRRQVDYALNKLNNWLIDNGMDEVEKEKGRYSLTEFTKNKVVIETKDVSESYITNENERTTLLYIYISCAQEYVSLEHFSQLFDVSKNTIIRDLKTLGKKLADYGLEVMYTRTEGYRIVGDETEIRNLLFKAINEINEVYELNLLLLKTMELVQEDIDTMVEKLDIVEQVLERKFADSYFDQLPYHVYAILRRANKHQTNDKEFFIDYTGISDTKEFEASEILLADQNLDDKVKMYIALRLLSTPIRSKSITDASLPELKEIISRCVINFEKLACINLQDKQQLSEKLYTHIKPAYFRIKYNLTTNYRHLAELDDKYETLFNLVNESFKPLETYLECEIPREEMMLITLFFGGNLIDTQEVVQTTVKKAVVVCPNGITISSLLESILIKLLPEIYFERSMSVREFNQSQYHYDFVFSQVPLQTNLNLIMIGDLQSGEERLKLRRRIISQLYDLPDIEFNSDKVFELIRKFADIHDEKGLKDALIHYFSDGKIISAPSNFAKGLETTLLPDSIQVVERVADFHEAITIASQPLLEKNIISQHYIDSMKEEYQAIEPHILLRMKIALPHSDINNGSHGLGLSFLKLNQPLVTAYGEIYFIAVLAAKDKESHLDSVLQLIKIAENDHVLDQLQSSTDKLEIYELLTSFK